MASWAFAPFPERSSLYETLMRSAWTWAGHGPDNYSDPFSLRWFWRIPSALTIESRWEGNIGCAPLAGVGEGDGRQVDLASTRPGVSVAMTSFCQGRVGWMCHALTGRLNAVLCRAGGGVRRPEQGQSSPRFTPYQLHKRGQSGAELISNVKWAKPP